MLPLPFLTETWTCAHNMIYLHISDAGFSTGTSSKKIAIIERRGCFNSVKSASLISASSVEGDIVVIGRTDS